MTGCTARAACSTATCPDGWEEDASAAATLCQGSTCVVTETLCDEEAASCGDNCCLYTEQSALLHLQATDRDTCCNAVPETVCTAAADATGYDLQTPAATTVSGLGTIACAAEYFGTAAATCATAGEAIALSGCAAKAACSTLSACSAGMKVKHDRSQTTLLTGLRLKQLGAVLQVDIAQASTLCAGDPCTVIIACKRRVSLALRL